MLVAMALHATLAASAAQSTEVTIYNQGFGLVKEVRRLDLKAGRQTVAIEDVAAMIEPSSVSIRNLTRPTEFQVLEQNYQFDLISPIAILNKSVGQRVRFVRSFGTQREVLEGTLLNAPTAIVGTADGGNHQTFNGMVIRTSDGRIVLNPTGEIEVQSVPEGLIGVPTLLWDVQSKSGGANDVEVSYLTRGLGWSADYVLTLDEPSSRGDLRGWVTIDNQSGATFREATLKLLAGDVRRVQPHSPGVRAPAMEMMDMAAKAGFDQESFFEYHLYTLQRPATVRQREIKQVSLLEAVAVPYRKKLIVDALMGFGQMFPNEGEIGVGTLRPQVRIEFENRRENNLGMPLPMGRIKVYQRDRSGSVQMIGEDQIQHTPRDERISLVVGRSFDVVAERKRTHFRRLGTSAAETSFEIELRNRKEVPETVHVYERHWGDWKVTQQNFESRKLDANTLEFVVELKPGETKKIVYTVETRW
jgi:hypothetical protein